MNDRKKMSGNSCYEMTEMFYPGEVGLLKMFWETKYIFTRSVLFLWSTDTTLWLQLERNMFNLFVPWVNEFVPSWWLVKRDEVLPVDIGVYPWLTELNIRTICEWVRHTDIENGLVLKIYREKYYRPWKFDLILFSDMSHKMVTWKTKLIF